MTCELPRDWQPTGKRGIHCEFPTKTNGVRALYAIYVRCARCGRPGFRKPGSPVVYTWNPEDAR